MQASWCSASEKVRLSHERRDNNRINLQPLGWCREGESIPAILKGLVKIPLSNYGAGLAETVTIDMGQHLLLVGAELVGSIVRTEIRVPEGIVTEDEACASSSFSMVEGAVGCFEEGEAPCASDSNRNERISATS
jgi:hypothetical protein